MKGEVVRGIVVSRRDLDPRPRRRGIYIPHPSAASPFFHLHAHSCFSANDALPQVEDMVDTVVGHGQPALAITDHGNMAASVRLYKAAKKAGILPFPGIEAYLKRDCQEKKAPRYHLGLVAFTTAGYEALLRLTSRSHTRERFFHKPHIDFTDLAEWKERGWTSGIAVTSGCYFGMVTQELVTNGYEAARNLVRVLAAWLPRFHIELQNHHIDHGDGWDDVSVAAALVKIADEVGLPYAITQDAHYCRASDKPIHETLKRIVAFGPDADDAVFPGDSFHLADTQWVREHHELSHWLGSEESLRVLLASHQLSIPELDTYHYNIPEIVPNPETKLAQLCVEEIKKLPKTYDTRLFEELDVIRATGMAGYLLLVKEVTDWCRANGVFTQARGSASGSLVCWLLGITQADPLKYNLRFERFISRDRTKPPDIDLDVEDTRRDDLMAWLQSRFNICQIGTWSEYSVDEKEGRGSLLIAYLSRQRKTGKSSEELSGIRGLADLSPNDQEELIALGKAKPFKTYGTHAAGVVITTTKAEFDRLVPTMLVASSDTTVTQFEMDDVEKLGLVKLDVLGLRTLSLLRRTVELMGRSVHEGLDWIPLTDVRTYTAIRNGATDGVFQLEGWTTRKGCIELGVRSLSDVIAVLALYRPAVMKSGTTATYIRRRFKQEATPEMHPILQRHLKETHGVPVFQEQVVSILRDLGFDPDDLAAFLKAVKASNANIGDAGKVIATYQEQFSDLAGDAGFSVADRLFTWTAIEGFAQYGFNRAHATSYGLTSARCAYLKTHYPLEFATALLETSAGTPKEKDYLKVVRDMGLRVMRPDINISSHTYSMDVKRKAIRKGLVSIHGVGDKAAREIHTNAPYDSIADVVARCNRRMVTGGKTFATDGALSGVLAKLDEAGALASLRGRE